MEEITELEPPNVITSDTPNATQVRPNEALPHKEQKFRRFRAYNTDTWNGPKRENKELIYRQDNLHRYDSIASRLDLTTLQKQRGRQLLDELDTREFGKSIDHLLFATCVVVANVDIPGGTRYWPHPNSKSNDLLFAEVADELEITRKQQLSAVQHVKSQTDL